VYGGLALAAYGEPRETKDADFAVCGAAAAPVMAALRAAGIAVSLTFDADRFGGHLITRVALLGATGHTGLNVLDLVQPRSARYAADALARALRGQLRGQALHVVAPEDFVLFKALSTRDRDLEDAASVVRALGDALDLGQVRAEAARLAQELPDHPTAARLEELLRR
jgi:hypothetical protein